MTPRPDIQPMARRREGFTLIELLVVISIIVMVVGLSFPFLGKMVSTSTISISEDTVSTTVSAARIMATRNIQFLQDLDANTSNGIQTSENLSDGYSGAAALFTPGNEIRVVENHELATDNFGDSLERYFRNGYRDVEEMEPVRLSHRVGVLGIRYEGGELQLVPPPFAVSFYQDGSLVVRTDRRGISRRSEGWVYYDGDGDGNTDLDGDGWPDTGYDRNQDRDSVVGSSDDNPAIWTREEGKVVASGLLAGRVQLPFEKIEPVVGVLVYSRNEVPSAYEIRSFEILDRGDASDEDTIDWYHENGRTIFFNRYTGTEALR
jgi:prepilin-type N-terminal cleavage/methylation domain-containing protein